MAAGRRAQVHGLARSLGRAQPSGQAGGAEFDQRAQQARLAVKLLARWQARESGAQMTPGPAPEVALAVKAPPAGEEHQGEHFCRQEGRGRPGTRRGAQQQYPVLAKVIGIDEKSGEVGFCVNHGLEKRLGFSPLRLPSPETFQP